ncbi:MAG: 30S ribosomal protein S4e [Candidatus Bathyarchaeota archaeon]|nr:30S ribosomal protein S4e [Candidatus Bathyarchaeota archaeon]
MGRKGGKKHLKRKPAPKFWPIHRKEGVFTVRPKPGPHPISRCLPLTLIVRDILGLAKTRREAKKIISQGKIWVDGHVQKEDLFPTGLMDVISIHDMEKAYRVIPSQKGLTPYTIGKKEEAGFKLCRIENKTTVKGGYTQLNFHDGRNVLIRVKDADHPEEDVFQTLDTLKIHLPDQKIVGHFKLIKGAPVIIIDGKNIGKSGKIVDIEKRPSQKRRSTLVTIEDSNSNRFQTTMEYIFVVGDKQPHISLTEVN